MIQFSIVFYKVGIELIGYIVPGNKKGFPDPGLTTSRTHSTGSVKMSKRQKILYTGLIVVKF